MDMPLRTVRTNIVQSIRAFRVSDLQEAAQGLGHHFLYANLADAQTKQDVLDMIGQQFMLPTTVSKNFDALYDNLTDPVHKSGPQPGFVRYPSMGGSFSERHTTTPSTAANR